MKKNVSTGAQRAGGGAVAATVKTPDIGCSCIELLKLLPQAGRGMGVISGTSTSKAVLSAVMKCDCQAAEVLRFLAVAEALTLLNLPTT